jgi:Toprim-like
MPGEPRHHWNIGDVLDRADLTVFLDSFAGVAARSGPGRRWHCPMPDHDDHHASVSVFRDRHGHERWRCWSGDHRGDAIDLVMIATGRNRSDAIDWLANDAGMVPDRPLPPLRPKPNPPAAALTSSPFVERYVRICERVLAGSQGTDVRDWLHARGLNDDTITANHLGADVGRQLMHRTRGLPYGAGPAAVFPALDAAGNVAYVQARYLDPDAAGRKYDNPAASLAPHPRLAFPVASDQRAGVLLVCEGIPDALIATQAGYRGVALLGAHTPDESVAMRIANHADNHHLAVAIVCDPDPAGRHATAILTRHLHDGGCEPIVIEAPAGCDLNAWALQDPAWAGVVDDQLSITAAAGVEYD